jgi:hypothetical protein
MADGKADERSEQPPRDLTRRERELTEHMIRQGAPTAGEFLEQLSTASARRVPPFIDFVVAEAAPTSRAISNWHHRG